MADSPHIPRFRADLSQDQLRGDERITGLQIAEADGAIFLFKLDSKESVVWDSWHMTADDAMNQAALEYDVPREQWKAIDGPQS
ncbi:MAG: hypothetical protein HEQ23_12070 [Tepidisphaera sp.]